MRKGEFDFCSNVEQPDPRLGNLGRRDFLYRFGKGLGSLALSSMLYQDSWLQAASNTVNPLLAKKPHFAPKAKSVIFLFMSGAPSQIVVDMEAPHRVVGEQRIFSDSDDTGIG